MTKTKILKTILQKEDKILDAFESLKDFLDSTEDEELSALGDDIYTHLVDIFHSSDIININDIKKFIDEEYECQDSDSW